MLLPQTKEREYRFRLALRMGIPIFALIITLISTTILSTHETLGPVFYFVSVILFVFSIYFILFLIYNGSEIRITDPITKTFTREYLFDYLGKELKRKRDYSLILINIENLNNINNIYGFKNGDRVLFSVAEWIGEYLESKDIKNFPLGHIKGGEFLIGLDGKESDYNTILDVMCIKSERLKVDDIEIVIFGVLTDSSYSKKLDYLMENLYEKYKEKITVRENSKTKEIDPNDLEMIVVNAIKDKKITVKTQDIICDDEIYMKECFIKLFDKDDKIIHQKQYMKVINRLGFEVEYDLIVLEKIVDMCLETNGSRYAFFISPRSLRNYLFISKAKELLGSLKESKSNIVFILSEVEYYAQIDKYNSILNSFRDLGVKIVIDRLGSLHTSFLYLKELNIDIVRFDSSYSKNLNYKDIVDGLSFIAHKKGIKTWMKMIENEDINEMANSLRIDYKQGKYLASVK